MLLKPCSCCRPVMRRAIRTAAGSGSRSQRDVHFRRVGLDEAPRRRRDAHDRGQARHRRDAGHDARRTCAPGLLIFGHRRAKDCSDIEVVSPIGADSAALSRGWSQGFEAIGETPIAAAIERAGQSMRAFKGQQNSIVLVTDGIEECRGDPCAAAAGAERISAST